MSFLIFDKSFSINATVFSTSTFLYFILFFLTVTFYRRRRLTTFQIKKNIPQMRYQNLFLSEIVLKSAFKRSVNELPIVLIQTLCGCAKLFQKEGICVFLKMFKSWVLLYKAETVEPILKSSEVLEKGFVYTFMKDWLKNTIFLKKGTDWRAKRKLLAPIFSVKGLEEEYIDIFNEQGRVLGDEISDGINSNQPIDAFALISRCFLEFASEFVLGTKFSSEDGGSSYIQAFHGVQRDIWHRFCRIWLWPDIVYFRTKRGKDYLRKVEIMDKFIQKIVTRKHQEKNGQMEPKETDTNEKCVSYQLNQEHCPKNQRRFTGLDFMLNIHFKDRMVTLENIVDEMNSGIFAAYETTTSSFTWTLYALGLYPEIQKKAYTEIVDVIGTDLNKAITINDIKHLEYLDCIRKEGLRLFPPGWYLSRTLEKDVEINGYTVSKGTIVVLFTYMLHRDPDVFSNPEVFDPDRFKPCNSAGRHQFAYIPFSAGPRNCPGKKIAELASMVILAATLRRFEVKCTLPLDKIVFSPGITYHPPNGKFIEFKPRN